VPPGLRTSGGRRSVTLELKSVGGLLRLRHRRQVPLGHGTARLPAASQAWDVPPAAVPRWQERLEARP
jgi:hypothetical protein